MSDPGSTERLAFTLDGVAVELDVDPRASLLSVLREQLGVTSAKDGCAPQGQCGCCTVLVDGSARVACVTPALRAAGRAVTTVDGLDGAVRDRLVDSFVAAGASQCGFCTPGIIVRLAALIAPGVGRSAAGATAPAKVAVDRALAAHLCRCTGWQTIAEALAAAAAPTTADLDAPLTRAYSGSAAHRATLESGGAQVTGPAVVLGGAGFADDTAPRGPGVLVAVPSGPAAQGEIVAAAGMHFVVADTLDGARAGAAKVPGRRTTLVARPPLDAPPRPPGGVRLATSWVEPGYLEPDASWCLPGGEPASPLANGGAFGAKVDSAAPIAARELADRFGRPVRVVWSREDVVRFGPKRPPVALVASLRDGARAVHISGRRMRPAPPTTQQALDVYGLEVIEHIELVDGVLPTGLLRAPWAESAVLIEGALSAAGVDRRELVRDERAAAVLLDTCVRSPLGAYAGARVHLDPVSGCLDRVEVAINGGDPLDATVLRSYCVGAAHQALGWVLSEGLAVDEASGEVHDLTIRSFGILRAKDMPRVEVTVVDDDRPPVAVASDAVFAATAAAAWIAVGLPEAWPALEVPAAARLRR